MKPAISIFLGGVVFLAIAALAVVFISPLRDTSNDLLVEGEFRGFKVIVSIDEKGRCVVLSDTSQDLERNYIYILASDIDVDYRFDNITLRNLPKGHPLEAYASLDSLEYIYEYFTGPLPHN